MKDNTKKALLLLGSLFVALIFLTSFVGNNSISLNGGNQSTKKNVTTVIVFGNVSVTVVGYRSSALITLLNSSFENQTNNLLLELENNNSITTYQPIGNQFSVYLNLINSYELKNLLARSIGSNSFKLSSNESVVFPSNAVSMYVGSHTVPVYFGSLRLDFAPKSLSPINSTVSIYVGAKIAYENGTYHIYNNNVTVYRSG